MITLVPRADLNRARGLQIYGYIREDGRAAMDAVGYEAAQDVMQRISVLVDYGSNPPTRSVEGEPPRLDTGELEANVTWQVGSDSDSIWVDVISRRPSTPEVPEELEYEKNRSYMRPSLENQRTEAPKIIQSMLR